MQLDRGLKVPYNLYFESGYDIVQFIYNVDEWIKSYDLDDMVAFRKIRNYGLSKYVQQQLTFHNQNIKFPLNKWSSELKYWLYNMFRIEGGLQVREEQISRFRYHYKRTIKENLSFLMVKYSYLTLHCHLEIVSGKIDDKYEIITQLNCKKIYYY